MFGYQRTEIQIWTNVSMSLPGCLGPRASLSLHLTLATTDIVRTAKEALGFWHIRVLYMNFFTIYIGTALYDSTLRDQSETQPPERLIRYSFAMEQKIKIKCKLKFFGFARHNHFQCTPTPIGHDMLLYAVSNAEGERFDGGLDPLEKDSSRGS